MPETAGTAVGVEAPSGETERSESMPIRSRRLQIRRLTLAHSYLLALIPASGKNFPDDWFTVDDKAPAIDVGHFRWKPKAFPSSRTNTFAHCLGRRWPNDRSDQGIRTASPFNKE